MPPPTSTQRPATPLAAVLAAACMIAQQVGGKATRDSLFLSSFGAGELPKAMLAAAVVSLVGVLAMSRALARFGPARLVPLLFACNAVAFGLEWLLVGRAPSAAAAALYLHVAVAGFSLISGFWSVINERFDPHTAKLVVGRIATGGIVGGLVGGVVAERVATYLDARAMLLVLSGLNLLCALGIWRAAARAAAPAPSRPRPTDAQGSALAHLRASRYLQLIGLLVALSAVTAGLIDYVFKAHAARAFTTRESLMGFFAIFYTATSFAAVALQAAVGSRALSRLGIGGTLALLPAALVLASALGATVMRLWTLVVVRGAQAVLESSLFRPAYELLYTPVSLEAKRPTKAVLDVGLDRVGGATAGALVMVLLAVGPATADVSALVLAIAAALASLWVAASLHRGYVAALATSLRSGAVVIDEADVVDATTRRTLSETTRAIERDKLLAQIQQLEAKRRVQQRAPGVRPGDVGAAEPPSALADETPSPRRAAAADADTPLEGPSSRRPPPSASEAPRHDTRSAWSAESFARRAAALCSDDPAEASRALERPLPRELVPLVIGLLGRDEAAGAARRALQAEALRVTGQLTDALRDAELSLGVRRRVASLLSCCPDPRAASALMQALEHDDDLEIRRRAARSLARIVEQDPSLAPRRRAVYRAAERELARDGSRELDHLFVVLGLALDAETLQLSLRALRSGDEALQGTALEYLDNVLPEAMADALWPALEQLCQRAPEGAGPASTRLGASKRSQKEIADELRRSVADLSIGRELLDRPAAR